MNATVTVREYARLTTSDVNPSLDKAQVTASAFNWLLEWSAALRSAGAPLVHHEGRQWLRLDNYVGVIETPCGTQIEILPKHAEDLTSVDETRRLLIRMIEGSLDIPSRNFGPATISAFDAPISEWVVSEFLDAVRHVIKRGVRHDYTRVQREERFLRGQLMVSRHIRRPPPRRHLFDVEYEILNVDHPENRLIRSALSRVLTHTKSGKNWRLAKELSIYLQDVPSSANAPMDFKSWRANRLMAHYARVRPWCELILNEQTPLTVSGGWRGLSFLFPMEKLFEAYVGSCLRRQIGEGCSVVRSVSSEYLCEHRAGRWFQLRPDLMVRQQDRRWILDAKWKLIDSSLSEPDKKYGLSQSDFYQLFAYGEGYLEGSGELFLVYPKTRRFAAPLPSFRFSETLTLWVVPFDLDRGEIDVGDATLPIRERRITIDPVAA